MSKYTDLITSEHAKRPKFVAAVDAATDGAVDQIAVMGKLPSDFDIDNAVGLQLDAVGEWVGITRRVSAPIPNVFFSFDIAGLGFDQGVWQGPYDPTTGLVSLPDDSYRLLLRATIGLNRWDGTVEGAQAVIAPLFPANTVYVRDNQDMSMSVVMAGPPPDIIAGALLSGGYLAIKPVTVKINYYFPTMPSGAVFGFDSSGPIIAGFDVGSWAAETPFTP